MTARTSSTGVTPVATGEGGGEGEDITRVDPANW